MTDMNTKQDRLVKVVVGRFAAGLLLFPVLIFLPAGTLEFWEGWLFLGVLFVPLFLVFGYLVKRDPELLRRRLKMREQQTAQRWILPFSILYLLAIFVLPGFDHRYGWSNTPAVLVIIADLFILVGYVVFFLVLRENSYASRVIEVVEGQRVISTGPYAWVRHPMYLGVTLIYVCIPLALGSLWMLLLSLIIIPILAVRIHNEEKLLMRDLPGYLDYMQKTRYRMFPGVW